MQSEACGGHVRISKPSVSDAFMCLQGFQDGHESAVVDVDDVKKLAQAASALCSMNHPEDCREAHRLLARLAGASDIVPECHERAT